MIERSGRYTKYSHLSYRLEGNLDRATGKILLWFPVDGLEEAQQQGFSSHARSKRLLHDLGHITTRPEIQLVTTTDIPTTTESPLIDESERLVKYHFNYDGLVIANTSYLEPSGDIALERCGLLAEQIFADQMVERVKS